MKDFDLFKRVIESSFSKEWPEAKREWEFKCTYYSEE